MGGVVCSSVPARSFGCAMPFLAHPKTRCVTRSRGGRGVAAVAIDSFFLFSAPVCAHCTTHHSMRLCSTPCNQLKKTPNSPETPRADCEARMQCSGAPEKSLRSSTRGISNSPCRAMASHFRFLWDHSFEGEFLTNQEGVRGAFQVFCLNPCWLRTAGPLLSCFAAFSSLKGNAIPYIARDSIALVVLVLFCWC